MFQSLSKFNENFPSVPVNTINANVECEYFFHAEHTYTDLSDRNELQKRVMNWISEKYIL